MKIRNLNFELVLSPRQFYGCKHCIIYIEEFARYTKPWLGWQVCNFLTAHTHTHTHTHTCTYTRPPPPLSLSLSLSLSLTHTHSHWHTHALSLFHTDIHDTYTDVCTHARKHARMYAHTHTHIAAHGNRYAVPLNDRHACICIQKLRHVSRGYADKYTQMFTCAIIEICKCTRARLNNASTDFCHVSANTCVCAPM